MRGPLPLGRPGSSPFHRYDGGVTRAPIRVLLAAIGVVLAVALVAAGCGAAVTTPPPATVPPFEPTPVPGGVSQAPDPLPDDVTTTDTEWGTILDAVPSTFPVYPGAEPAEQLDEPFSAAWIAASDVEQVAGWYRDALPDGGFGVVELSDALEDGGRILDAWGDIPECRAQLAFRPVGESTIITVLYAAACAGGEG
jgi:hypothetical protein